MNGYTNMRAYQPETEYLQEVGLAILEQGASGIVSFISDDKQHIVVVVDTPIGAKRFKATAENGQTLPYLEITIAEQLRKAFLDMIVVEF